MCCGQKPGVRGWQGYDHVGLCYLILEMKLRSWAPFIEKKLVVTLVYYIGDMKALGWPEGHCSFEGTTLLVEFPIDLGSHSSNVIRMPGSCSKLNVSLLFIVLVVGTSIHS